VARGSIMTDIAKLLVRTTLVPVAETTVLVLECGGGFNVFRFKRRFVVR
jgi:hypothetical protein